jgi:hypothetical protein
MMQQPLGKRLETAFLHGDYCGQLKQVLQLLFGFVRHLGQIVHTAAPVGLQLR